MRQLLPVAGVSVLMLNLSLKPGKQPVCVGTPQISAGHFKFFHCHTQGMIFPEVILGMLIKIFF